MNISSISRPRNQQPVLACATIQAKSYASSFCLLGITETIFTKPPLLDLLSHQPSTGISRALKVWARVSWGVSPRVSLNTGVSEGVSYGPKGPRDPCSWFEISLKKHSKPMFCSKE